MKNVSLKVKNYKCFGNEFQGFDKIYPINVIIGRNNTGKSSLLELVQYAVLPSPGFKELKHRGRGNPEVIISQPLQESELKRVFPPDSSGGGIPGSNHWEYGSRWIGKTITYRLEHGLPNAFVGLDPPFDFIGSRSYSQQLADLTHNMFSGKIFKHLSAERDILPEKESGSLNLDPKGSTATNIIQRFINISSLPSSLVDKTLLGELNQIYSPDSNYSRISVQREGEGAEWEIFLDEEHKGKIPLSHTGSGFKTILLVLIFLHLIPYVEKRALLHYIFAFEELENNLHPALQRRLLMYLRDFAVQKGCIFFLTTHSNIAIDMFSRDSQAQIMHVTHDGEKAYVKNVQTYIDNKGILDDLDIRASDLLQANSIIWVEGPSDRLYVNRWIELRSHGELKEGVHYQCMFYAGRLLAHLSLEDPEIKAKDAIFILRLNRNAAIIIDSDKQSAKDEINNTKKRISEEIKEMGGLVWITAGKEVENYIPVDSIARLLGKTDLPPLSEFEDIADYLEKNIGSSQRKKFEKEKPLFAAGVSPWLTEDNIRYVLDLSDKINELCDKIKEWNKVPFSTI